MPTRLLIALITLGVSSVLLTACGGGDGDGDSRADTIASADHPVALAFAPDGRLFVAEKFTGVIRVVGPDGSLIDPPFADLDVAEWLGLDWGLTGLAVAPDFASSPYLYAFYTQRQPSSDAQPIGRPALVRLEASTNVGGPQEVILASFPDTEIDHQGFRANGPIHFGPDGNLYLAVGDYDYGKAEGPNGLPYSQDLSQVVGKLLRVDPAGNAPADNPFSGDSEADSRVFAYGFAHASDFAFQPSTGSLFNTDATDSCEELNGVAAGGNYSWPDVGEFPFPDCTAGQGTAGIYFLSKPDTEPGQFQSTVGVSGMAFLTGDKYPSVGEGLLICESDTKRLRLLTLGGGSGQEVMGETTIVDDCTGSVTVGPDGLIYYSNETSVRRVKPDELP